MTHMPTMVDPPAALAKLRDGGALLVDVRERGEVARAAFDAPNVVQMPLSEFERRHAELPQDRELIMACASGARSFQAMQYLAHHGWRKLCNLQGGLGVWHAHGLPVRV